jgi:hypothetical protein
MIAVTIDIPLKKGVTATTRWNITQDVPFPDITGECGRLAWRNFGGLLREYGREPSGLAPHYSLYMDVGNPEGQAFFSYRGLNLEEIRADIKRSPWDSFVWKVRRSENPRDSERSLLDLYVKPVILQAIEDHKEELKADAIKRLKEHVHYQLNEAKNRIEKLDKEMSAAIAAL